MPTLSFRRLVLILCLVSVPALAQTTSTSSPPTSDPQAVALLQKSLAALTGNALISDATLTGTVQRVAGSNNETGTVLLRTTALGDSRIDMTFPGGNRNEIRNHAGSPLATSSASTISGTQSPQPVGATLDPNGTVHPMALNNLRSDPTWFFPPFTLERVSHVPSYVLSYIGEETHEGEAVLHVFAYETFPQTTIPNSQFVTIMKHLSGIDLYFDPTTFLPIALAFDIHSSDNLFVDIAEEIRFSQYQTVNGVRIPFHVQRYINNGLGLDLQFSGLTMNSGVPATTFAIE